MPPSRPAADRAAPTASPSRLAELESYAILDTPPEPGFDDIARLARALCGTPVALVSLVDADRQWFKARAGFEPCQTGLESSVCVHTLGRTDVLVIEDLTADPRTRGNPLVTGPPHMRFYAGAPLISPAGEALGALCVIDSVVRPGGLAPAQREHLVALAGQVMTQLALRRSLKERDEALRRHRAGQVRHRRILDSAVDYAIVTTDLTGAIDGWSEGAERILAWSAAEILGRPLATIFTDEDIAAGVPDDEMRAARERGRGSDERWHRRKDATRFFAAGETMPLTDESDAHVGYLKILRDRTRDRRRQDRLALFERASSGLLGAAEPGEVLTSVLEAGAETLGFESSYLYDVTADGAHLRLTHSIGVSPEDCEALQHASFDVPLCGIVARTGRRLVLSDLQADPDPRFRIAVDAGVQAYAGFPLTRQGRVFGVLSFTTGRERGFDDESLRFFGTVAGYLSVVRERHATLTALRQSEERLQIALEAAELGTWDLDLATDTSVRSPRHDQIFGGVDPDAPWGLAAAEARVLPEDRPVFREAFARGRSGGTIAFEVRIRAANGDIRWISVRGRTHFDAGGRAVRMAGVVADVTLPQRDALQQAALLEFSDRSRDLDDPAALTRLADATIGSTLAVDRVGYVTMGRNEPRPTVRSDWLAATATGLEAGSADAFGEWIAATAGGETIVRDDVGADHAGGPGGIGSPVRAFVHLPILEDGRFLGLLFVHAYAPRRWSASELAFLRAVVEQARVTIGRRRAEHKLRALADSLEQQVAERTRERDRIWRISHDPFLVADAAGRWLAVNPAWTTILGWTESELLGRTSEWMEHPDDRRRTRAEVGALAEGRTTTRFENRFRARDGRYRWFSWTAVPSDGLSFCVARDVTDEKALAAERGRLEAQLRQSQKMEAVGQLTGGLAHDFNNLLAGITGAIELMQLRIAQGRLAELDRYLAMAKGAAQSAATLTHRLLAFSRQQTLDQKATDVNALVQGMEEFVQRAIGPGIRLEVVRAPDLWTAMIDAGQLENAVLNLCLNARDAMPRGGRIVVETANRTLAGAEALEHDLPEGDYLGVAVADDGVGMSAELAARVFEPFFTTKPAGQGTGLGLAMVYGFAKQSGGQVRIVSAVGRGTTVRLFLPRHHGDAEAAGGSAGERDASRVDDGQTALVVDDEPAVRMLVAEVLQDMGYRTIEAVDGAAGLGVLRSNARIDLLVTDVGLPGGMNGRQMVEASREVRPALKVLYITGYAEAGVLDRAQLAPGDQVMTKPFGIDALAARVRALAADGRGDAPLH